MLVWKVRVSNFVNGEVDTKSFHSKDAAEWYLDRMEAVYGAACWRSWFSAIVYSEPAMSWDGWSSLQSLN